MQLVREQWHLYNKMNINLAILYNNNIMLNLLIEEYPAHLHATLASSSVQKSSQTVPQVSSLQTSTRPSLGTFPLTSLILPLMQAASYAHNIIVAAQIIMSLKNAYVLDKQHQHHQHVHYRSQSCQYLQ